MESAKPLIDRITNETGYSKAAIARKIGITPPYLSRLYSGVIQFTPGMYARLTKSFPMIWPEMAEGVPYYESHCKSLTHCVSVISENRVRSLIRSAFFMARADGPIVVVSDT